MTAPVAGSQARNFLALGGGEAVSRLVAFATILLLARRLGPENYGIIAFAAGVTLYFAKLAEFALDYVGVAAVAAATGAVDRLGSVLLTARFLATAIVVGVAVLAAHWLLPEPDRTVLSLYLLTLLPVAANPRWLLIGLRDARAVGGVRVAGELLALAVVFLAVRTGTELWAAPVAVGTAELLAVVVLLAVLRLGGHRLRPALDRGLVVPVARRAASIVALSLLGLVIYNSGLLFLRGLRDAESAGQYAAAFTLIGFLANLGLAYAMTLIPGLARLRHAPGEARDLYGRSLALVHAAALPLAVGGWMLAGRIIELGFGAGYQSAGTALAILAWAIPLMSLRNVPLAALVAGDRQHLLLRATAIAVAVSLVLNLALIPPLGIRGAAIASVATESLAGILTLWYAARDGLGFVPLRQLWKPLVAGAVMAGALWFSARLPLPATGLVGAGSYLAALAALGGLRLRRGTLPQLDS